MKRNHPKNKMMVFLAGGAIIIAAASSSAAAQTNSRNDPESFDKIARTLFKPIYPLLALQIKQDFGIVKGICIDAGSGPGYLAIELAKITDLEIHSLDIDPKASDIARRNIQENGVANKIKAVTADVQKMPFPDGFADLVVSRGSYLFWPDKVKAFKEILRILKPGGTAFIGGGMGNLLPPEERRRIKDVMAEKNIGPPLDLKVNPDDMTAILRQAGIPVFRITTDEECLCGLWVEFQKPSLSKKGSAS